MMNRIRWNIGALALVVGLGLGVAAPAAAQEPAQREGARMEHRRPDPQRMIERRVAMLTEQLGLTPDQAAHVREIFAQEAEQRKAIFEKAGFEPGRARRARDGQRPTERQGDDAQRAALRTELRQLHEQTEQQLLALLDEQQKEKYEGMKKEMRSRGRRGRG